MNDTLWEGLAMWYELYVVFFWYVTSGELILSFRWPISPVKYFTDNKLFLKKTKPNKQKNPEYGIRMDEVNIYHSILSAS